MTLPLTLDELRHILPAEWCRKDVWLPWVATGRSNGKTSKVPSHPHGGQLVPADFRRGGRSLESAYQWMTHYGAAGVGVIVDGLTWSCLDLDGPLEDWQTQLCEVLGPAGYVEWSPSGIGLHLWLPVSGQRNRRVGQQECLTRGFVTVTGNAWQPKQTDALMRRADVGRSPHRSDEEIMIRLLGARNHAKVAALLAGEWQSRFTSQSEADYALARAIRFWTQDAEQIERIMRRSAQNRAKWSRSDYLQRTIERALAAGGPLWEGDPSPWGRYRRSGKSLPSTRQT